MSYAPESGCTSGDTPDTPQGVSGAQLEVRPQDLAGEAQVLRWSVAALSSVEVPALTTLLDPYTHVREYLARCLDRPAWRRTFDAYSKRVQPA